jgi:hypothetical protein
MKLNAFATSMSFASATKVNGLHLHSELPRKRSDLICLRLLPTKQMDHPLTIPMPSIHKLFKCFEGFTYCTALDLNMGFWTILLDKPSQHLCTINLPWGKYCYLHLPMGLACSPDIYQEKMSELFIDMIFIIVYHNDILVFTFNSVDDHLRQLENVFKWLHCNNLHVNAKISSFCALKTKYLGFILVESKANSQLPLCGSEIDTLEVKVCT